MSGTCQLNILKLFDSLCPSLFEVLLALLWKERSMGERGPVLPSMSHLSYFFRHLLGLQSTSRAHTLRPDNLRQTPSITRTIISRSNGAYVQCRFEKEDWVALDLLNWAFRSVDLLNRLIDKLSPQKSCRKYKHRVSFKTLNKVSDILVKDISEFSYRDFGREILAMNILLHTIWLWIFRAQMIWIHTK